MADFEDLRLKDLLEKFQKDIEDIQTTRSLKKFSSASRNLQNVYNFFVTAQNPYNNLQETFKNLFSSFNYAAVLVNASIKDGKISPSDGQLLNECLEIMTKCCNTLISSL